MDRDAAEDIYKLLCVFLRYQISIETTGNERFSHRIRIRSDYWIPQFSNVIFPLNSRMPAEYPRNQSFNDAKARILCSMIYIATGTM